MTELDKLIDAVERGVDTAHHHAAALPSESAYGKCTWHDSHKASSGSLDAAKALHDALLPEWDWGRTEGNMYVKDPFAGSRSIKWGGPSGNPARAWLIAILKSYRSKNAHSHVHQRTP